MTFYSTGMTPGCTEKREGKKGEKILSLNPR